MIKIVSTHFELTSIYFIQIDRFAPNKEIREELFHVLAKKEAPRILRGGSMVEISKYLDSK